MSGSSRSGDSAGALPRRGGTGAMAWFAGGAAFVAVFVSQAATSVWAPVLALATLAGLLLVRELRRNEGRAPLNAGVLYLAVIALYGLYPLLQYAALGGVFTPLNDSRLFDIQPRPDLVARIGWYCVTYAAAFLAAYCLVTGDRRRGERAIIRPATGALLWSILVLFIVFRGVVFVADAFYSAPGRDYLESYLRYAHLPLVAQQLLGHATGMLSILGIALVTVACLDWRRLRWWLAAWLTLEFVGLILGGGSRTEFVLLVLALAVAYHMLVRPLRIGVLVMGGFFLVVGFLALGALRAYELGGTVGAGLQVLVTANEFEALFGNAIDLERLVATGRVDRAALALPVYLGDIIGLVPQQLAPFEKVNLTRWYVETFYPAYAEIGGGFAFGAVAESMIGAGPIDLLWRGALVGVMLGWLDRRILSGPVSLTGFVVYVWILSSCYLMFRVTTLALLPVFVYRVLPVLILVLALAELLHMAGRVAHSADRARAATP